MTGRRPKRSDKTPMTGEKKNCISAKMVPNHPSQLAALTESPPRKSRINFGSTGAIKPSASMSSMIVMKIKTTAAGRDFMMRIAAIFTCHSSLVTRHFSDDAAFLSLSENGSAGEQNSWARIVRDYRHWQRRNRGGEGWPHCRSKNFARRNHAAALTGRNSDRQ